MPTIVKTAASLAGPDWSNKTNVGAADGSYAEAVQLGGGIEDTDALICEDFGFAIPLGATGVSVQAIVRRRNPEHGVTGVIDFEVYERAGGVRVGSNLAGVTYWGSSFTNEVYNLSETDPAAINDPEFGFEIAATLSADMDDIHAQIDYVAISVTYDSPVPPPPRPGTGGLNTGGAFFMMMVAQQARGG